MGVLNAGTTSIGLVSDMQLNSASAAKIESNPISLKEVGENHYAPPTPGSGADKISLIYNKTFRVIAFQASRCTVTVTYPTTYNAWKWKTGDSANGTASMAVSHADYITNGRSLYLRGTSYSTYSSINLSITPDYGYSVSSYAFYNRSGTFISGHSTTATTFSLHSSTHTGESLFFMRWFAT